MKMSSVGRMGEFNPSEEDISSYLLRLKHYFIANDVKSTSKVSVLITVLGPKVLAVLTDIVSPDKVDDLDFDNLVKVLEKHFSPKRLVVVERYVFNSRSQRSGESIADFVVAIKHLSGTCNFGTFLKDALRDRLISGISNEGIRQKLLSDEKDFDQTLALALTYEQADKHTNMFHNRQENFQDVNKFHVRKTSWPKSSKTKGKVGSDSVSSSFKCFRCLKVDHKPNECPYLSYKCHQCQKVGHLGKACKGKDRASRPTGGRLKVHQMTESPSEELEELSLYNIGLDNPTSCYKVRLAIENVEVDMEHDTGSAITVCPLDFYEKHFSHVQLACSNIKLRTYSGDEVRVVGQVEVNVTYEKSSYRLPITVVDVNKSNSPLLLGRNWLQQIVLNWNSIFSGRPTALQTNKLCARPRPSPHSHDALIEPSLTQVKVPNEVELLKNKYLSVFKGKMGEIKDVKAHIVLREGSTPKFCKFRPVPFSLRQKVEDELQKMVDEGVAYPVTSSEWGTPLVVIPKQHGVRLCGDFKVTLNQVIQHEHYPLPQPDDIFTALSGCQFFSVLDLQSAYLQMPVAESSQELLTLTTHKGLFRLRRLPFGLSSAPALFQAAMDKILAGLSGTVAYLDDVIVGGTTRKEAYSRLELVLQRLSEYGVKVNESKCNFLQSQVEYLGYCLSAEGISPQVGIIDAIRNAPEPTNKEELRAYIGLINYYGRFIPNLSDKLSCFYDLTKKDVSWKWTKECSNVFQLSKTWVCDLNILVHYDVSKPLVLTCDASPRGVGAVLSHIIDGEERPIAFASKSLSASEKNYSQLHREALALVFGAKKFHKYIYGRMNVILQTDHQPLTTIFGSKKGIPSLAAARLQRWALILSTYNFEVKYRRGSEVSHADALSRLPLPVDEPLELEANYVSHVEECLEVFNCKAVSENPLTSLDIARFTGRDPVLSRIRDFLWHGWRDVTDPKFLPYVKRKDELAVDDNCVLWGSRVVIPEKLKEDVVRLLHDQHPGIVRMKLLARSYIWWPGLEQTIENMVRSCHICQSSRNSSVKVPLQQWPRSTRRWQRVHIDFAEEPTSRQQLLVLVDTYSRWIEVFLMNSTTTASTISRLRTLFASYGLPEELVSDNQSTFTSSEFREFLAKNSIKFTLTPPYHPASNGAAERSVQIVKRNLLRQVMGEGTTGKITLQHKLDNFLISYRNTPCSVTGLTPAEMFLNWKPRTKLALLKPNLQQTIDQQRDRQKKSADKYRGKFRSFEEGELVLVRTVRNEKISWVPGKILQKRSPVTYIVAVLGSTRFCHTDHLRVREYQLKEEEPCIPRRSFVPVTPVKRTVVPKSPEKQSPPKKSTPDDPLEAELQSPVVQCSPPQLRCSGRAVRKPERLDL